MIRREETANVKRATTSRNNYGEVVKGTYTTLETIAIAISASNGATSISNNILTTQSTHIGVCNHDNIIQEGDRIEVVGGKTYAVDFVV